MESAENQTIKERLKSFIKSKGLGQSRFEVLCGLSNGYVNNIRQSITPEKLQKISLCFPELNPGWLMTGEGEMLKSTEKKVKLTHDENGVPYYDINVTASITESFSDIPEMPSYTINIPYLNDCTAAFPVFGDSMMPTYNPGDTVVVKEVKNKDAMLWGETYLVITDANCDNLRTIKRVYISDDRRNFILRANNPAYAGDTIVPCDNVVRIFIVKGKISRTQL